jgi:hypothetical protein
MHCKDVTFSKLGEYIDFLRNREGHKAIEDKTIANHFVIISKILTHGIKLGYLTQVRTGDFPMPQEEFNAGFRARFAAPAFANKEAMMDELMETGLRHGPDESPLKEMLCPIEF